MSPLIPGLRSYESVPCDVTQEAFVLVIYVGGTIGMVKNNEGVYVPTPKALVKRLRSDQRMHDASYQMKKNNNMDDTTLVLSEVYQMRRIIYTIYEYEPLIDSCNVASHHWDQIATDIYKNYQLYDGFVILHGTDTLAYTASALSFMLEYLGKSVIITGSQIPMFETRSDGFDNFLGSLILASNFTIPEVMVFFHNKLMRGNRTIKFSSSNLDAFVSPNATDIAKLGTEIIVNYNEIFISNNLEKFTIQTQLDEHVGILRIFPNIKLSLVKSFLESGLKGVILETFGCGNFISSHQDFILEIKNAVEKGVLIINCTQCYNGNVAMAYETGQVLTQVGVLCGYDMTTEAALSKLSYVLTKKNWDLNMKKMKLCMNLRGEMTNSQWIRNPKMEFMNALGKSLGIYSKEEIADIDKAIFPALVIHAVNKVDFKMLDKLKSCGANFNTPNDDYRTPLHIACCIGNVKLIDYLLHSGCLVHVKDRENKTPLLDAVLNDHSNAIRLLRKCGAHFPENDDRFGENICSAASKGSIVRLMSYQLAGVDLNRTDYCGRTPLHAAVINGQNSTVEFLIKNGASTCIADALGHTALDYASILSNRSGDITSLLKKIG